MIQRYAWLIADMYDGKRPERMAYFRTLPDDEKRRLLAQTIDLCELLESFMFPMLLGNEKERRRFVFSDQTDQTPLVKKCLLFWTDLINLHLRNKDMTDCISFSKDITELLNEFTVNHGLYNYKITGAFVDSSDLRLIADILLNIEVLLRPIVLVKGG